MSRFCQQSSSPCILGCGASCALAPEPEYVPGTITLDDAPPDTSDAARIDRIERTLLLLMARPPDFDWQVACERLALEMHRGRDVLGFIPPQFEGKVS